MAVIVNENFDDQAYTHPPLNIWNLTEYDTGIVYAASPAHGGTGYSVQGTHIGGDVAGILANLASYLSTGLYFRYWVYYPASYYFPGDESLFENLKIFKIAADAGSPDIEFIYKDSAGGPSSVNYQMTLNDDSTQVDTIAITQLAKDAWHKIEIYIRIPASGSNSVSHLAIDGVNVWNLTNANIHTPGSAYTGTNQFLSIRASNAPPAGHGTWYFDDVYIADSSTDLVGTGAGESPVALANDGKKYYYRFRVKSAAGLVSGWSKGDDYFMMSHAPTGVVTFPAITATGAGIKGGAKSASGEVTFPAMTATGAGDVGRLASGTGSFPAMTAAGQAALGRFASGTATFPAITAVGVGELAKEGSGTGTFPAITAEGTANIARKANGTLTMPALTATGAAKVGRLVSGQATFPAMTAIGVGHRGRIAGSGLGAFPGPFTAVGLAKVGRLCSGTATFPALTSVPQAAGLAWNPTQQHVAWTQFGGHGFHAGRHGGRR